MSIPLLNYSYSSQNQRVDSYEVASEETPRIYNSENSLDNTDLDNLIRSAYVQIFNEQQLITSNRQFFLESQLKAGQITVKDFIRGLLSSDCFRRRNYEVNNNYRFVEMCIQRVLGREVYDQNEKFAWSVVIATKGLEAFFDSLLDTQEYMKNFGDDIVPYQRRRILVGHEVGNLPFTRMPRYGKDHLAKLEAIGYFQNKAKPEYRWQWQKPPYPKVVRGIGSVIAISGAIFVSALIIASALSAWGLISL